jgi:hypothetical protein
MAFVEEIKASLPSAGDSFEEEVLFQIEHLDEETEWDLNHYSPIPPVRDTEEGDDK